MSSPVVVDSDHDDQPLKAFRDEDFSRKLRETPEEAALHLKKEFSTFDRGSKRRLANYCESIVRFAEEQPGGLNILLRHHLALYTGPPLCRKGYYKVSYVNLEFGVYSVDEIGIVSTLII